MESPVEVKELSGYEVLSVLGYGANSTIYRVREPDNGQLFAIKRVIRTDATDQRFVDQMINEFKVSGQLEHEHLRKCIALKKKKNFMKLEEMHLVMQLVEGKNLVERKPESLLDLVRIFRIVTDVLIAISDAGYIHADMKPNNIIMDDDNRVTVIDLGQSCPSGTIKQRIQGTPDYIAPEQVKRRPLTSQTDMFNLGATMYWCVTDRHIPTLISKDDQDRTDMDRKFYRPNEVRPEIPHALNQLILDCLRTRPVKRPESWHVIRDRLELVHLQLQRARKTSAKAKPSD